ncbi:MAG: hypothetical protein ACI4BD_07140 [Paludibacteraceae bacterium]
MKKQFLLFATIAVALVGCKQEQSELSFDNIKDVATISGNVSYSTGQYAEENNYNTEVTAPAVGKTVYVDIPYSSYSAGATGKKTFTTVVDSLGNYTLSIPVPTVGVSGASLRFEEFTAEQSLYQRMEEGQPVFETRMCKFTLVAPAGTLPQTLKPEPCIVRDLVYDREVIDMKDYAETATLTGSLLLPYEESFRTGKYKAAANCAFEITIMDGEEYAEYIADPTTVAKPNEFTYGTVTNAQGAFTVNLPIKNLKKGFRVVKAAVVPQGETQFTHYTNLSGNTEKLSGAYLIREDLSLMSVSEVVAGVACNIGARPLKFVPGYNNGIDNAQAPATWEENLAGWVFAESDFSGMTATSTISGSIALARETGFGLGDYATSAQTVTISGEYPPYSRGFVVLTKADGTFQLNIPTAEEGVNPSGTWNVSFNQPNAIAFTHYTLDGKELILKEGSYNEKARIRATDAAWNELGKYYYTFSPATSVNGWCGDLAGWAVIPGYEETATVKAKLLFATETGYCTGKRGGLNLRAQLTVNYDGNYHTFVAPVTTDGTFQVTIPVKSVNSTMNADNIALFDQTVDNFKHYLSAKTEILEGNYTKKKAVEAADGAWNNKWTIYYDFTPTSAATDYTSDLLGWMIVPEGYTTETWTSTIQMPVETGFWIGSYEPLARKKVQVTYTMGGTTYRPVVLTDANGIVTCPIYMQYGIETPSISIAIFEDEMVHRFNPKNAEATTTLQGSYSIRTRIPEVAAWNAERTYYMQFNPASSVDQTLLSWTNNIAEWYVIPDQKVKATIKLYAQKAIETTTSNNHEAGWSNADKAKATITIYNPQTGTYTTIKRQVSGRNINFSFPVNHEIEEGTTKLHFTISLENETGNTTLFNHYADPSANTITTLYGNYENAGNVYNLSATAEGTSTKSFELKQSAKWLFYYYDSGVKTLPAGYSWDTTHEI